MPAPVLVAECFGSTTQSSNFGYKTYSCIEAALFPDKGAIPSAQQSERSHSCFGDEPHHTFLSF